MGLRGNDNVLREQGLSGRQIRRRRNRLSASLWGVTLLKHSPVPQEKSHSHKHCINSHKDLIAMIHLNVDIFKLCLTYNIQTVQTEMTQDNIIIYTVNQLYIAVRIQSVCTPTLWSINAVLRNKKEKKKQCNNVEEVLKETSNQNCFVEIIQRQVKCENVMFFIISKWVTAVMMHFSTNPKSNLAQV